MATIDSENDGERAGSRTGSSAVPPPLGTDRRFSIFLFGWTLSMLGDAFAFIAVPLLVLETTGSLAQMGMVTAAFGLSQFAMGWFAGMLVDRFDRRRLMLLCDVARVLVYSLIPLAWWLGFRSMWIIYVVMILGALFGNVYLVTFVTVIPNLVPKEQLTKANGRVEAAGGLTFLVGPMLAGLVIARFGAATGLAVNALSFIASTVSLLLIRFNRRGDARAEGKGALSEFLKGLRFVARHPLLRAASVFFAMCCLVDGGLYDLAIFHLKQGFGLGDRGVGLSLGAAAFGAVTGGLCAPIVCRRIGFGRCLLGGTLLQALSLIMMGISHTYGVFLVTAITWAMSMIVRRIAYISLRQMVTPDHLLGRVTAACWTLSAAFTPVGAALSTRIAESIGPRIVLSAMGILLILVVLAALPSPISARSAESAMVPPAAVE
jgi:MFS family permease